MNESATDPMLIFVGITIIILLVAVLTLLLRRDRPNSGPSLQPPAPSPPPSDPFRSEPRGRRIVLSGFDHNNKAVRFEFTYDELKGQGIVIGRSREANAQVGLDDKDNLVSRHHARLFSENERLFLEDLKSLNRTFINSTALPNGGSAVVEFGNEIAIGPKVKLRLSKLG